MSRIVTNIVDVRIETRFKVFIRLFTLDFLEKSDNPLKSSMVFWQVLWINVVRARNLISKFSFLPHIMLLYLLHNMPLSQWILILKCHFLKCSYIFILICKHLLKSILKIFLIHLIFFKTLIIHSWSYEYRLCYKKNRETRILSFKLWTH